MSRTALAGAFVVVIVALVVLSGSSFLVGASASPPAKGAPPVHTVSSAAAATALHRALPSSRSLSSLFDGLFHARPSVSAPSVAFVAGVAGFTTDPAVANNTGVNASITLPTAFTPPAGSCFSTTASGITIQICAFLGVEEPINATETAGIGCILASISGLGSVAFPVGILPGTGNGSFIYNISTTAPRLTFGTTYDFAITWSHTDWWTFSWNGNLLTGSSKGQNGTYDLNNSVALGISGAPGTGGGLGSIGGGPAQVLFELGNVSYNLPQVAVPNAIGIEPKGGTSESYRPVSGNAVLLNSSFPITIEGKDQTGSGITSIDKLIEGGSPVNFPGQYASLWGDAKPLGIYTPETAVYTSETTVDGASGLAFNVTIPSTLSQAAGTAEVLALQAPVTSSEMFSVGVEFVGTNAYPFYAVRNALTESTYTDLNDSLSADTGKTVAFSVDAVGADYWSFTANGAAIATTTGSAKGNGTADLGANTATVFESSTIDPGSVLFSETTFPILALFGNGTMSSLDAPVAMAFHLPGRGWVVPDYGLGYWWTSGFDVEGNLQLSTLAHGEAMLGSALSSPMTGNLAPIWQGALALTLTASSTTVFSGQSYNVTANLSSTLAPPASPGFCGKATPARLQIGDSGCSLVFILDASASSLNWSVWVAQVTAQVLTGSSPSTQVVNVVASPSEPYATANESVSVNVIAPTLTVASRASPSTVNAGSNAKILLWVNNTENLAVSDAFVNTSGSVPGLGKTASAVSGSPGEYTDTLRTSASLASVAHYNITFFANQSSSVGGQSTVAVNVIPLAQLEVSASSPAITNGVASATTILLTVTVMANDSAVTGATVTMTVTPGSPSWSGTVGPWITGTNGETQWAMESPNVTAKTAFVFELNATNPGNRPGTTNVTVEVTPAPTSSPTSSGSDTFLYVGIGVAVAVVAVVALLLMMRRKKTASMGMPPPGQDYQGAPPQ